MNHYLICFNHKGHFVVVLYENLQTFLFSILKLFVRSEVLDKSITPRKLMTINFNNDQSTLINFNNILQANEKNILQATSVNVRFGARKILNKFSAVQVTEYQAFYQNAYKFLFHFVEKLYGRCPLKYPVTRVLSPLSLLQAASKSVLIKWLANLLEIWVNAGWISSIHAGRAQTEYANMIKNKAIRDVVHEFYIKDWLDDFYLKILN